MRNKEKQMMMKASAKKKCKKKEREKKKKTSCSIPEQERPPSRDLHTLLDMSLPDLFTSGSGASSSSLPACLPACPPQLSTATTSLTESCPLLRDKLHPQESEMSRAEGGLKGRKSALRTPCCCCSWISNRSRKKNKKPKDKH